MFDERYAGTAKDAGLWSRIPESLWIPSCPNAPFFSAYSVHRLSSNIACCAFRKVGKTTNKFYPLKFKMTCELM